ncbi:MAG: hypothetical protein L3J09_00105 [Flavobacteriaceae bacterium]|nr:hypothetical protein [Flavobacteriaceae bacterium]
MLKNILNLEGAQQLSKKEQSSINGGKAFCQHCNGGNGGACDGYGNCYNPCPDC